MDWGILALALVGAGIVWVRTAQTRREEERQDAEREGFRHRISQDPNNAGAYEALGDSLRTTGRLQEAYEAYQSALNVSGAEAITSRVQYKLRQVDLDIRDRETRRLPASRQPAPELYFCPQCGGANPPSRRVCETCGATLPHDSFREALRDKEAQRASLESAACVLVLLAALRIAAAQPLEVKGVLVMATIIVVAWRFLQAIGSPRL